MPISLEKINLPFKRARLSMGKSWEIVYYIFNQQKNKYERFRIKINNQIKHIDSLVEKIEYAEDQVEIINQELKNQYYNKSNNKENLVKNENIKEIQPKEPVVKPTTQNQKTLSTRASISIEQMISNYLNIRQRDLDRKELSDDTYNCYKSRCNALIKFLKFRKQKEYKVIDINTEFIKDYSYYLFHIQGLLGRSHNNNFLFLKQLILWIELEELKELDLNIFNKLKKKPKEKIRQPIPDSWMRKIIKDLKVNSPGFLIHTMMTYYLFIRAKESIHLQVKHINLKNNTVLIEDYFSKNNKTELITIPKILLKYIQQLNLDKYPSDYYIFSTNEFTPGIKQAPKRRVGASWEKLRERIQLPKKYQWYSLKDSGIENMLQSGIPTIDVQRQCRHHELKMTEIYLKKKIVKAAPSILNLPSKY